MLRNLKSPSLLAIIVLIISVVPTVYSATTKVKINPPTTAPLAGQSFTVNVTVTNVLNLNSWQTVLSFNPTILNCTGLSIPSDSIFAGKSYFFPAPIIDNTVGRIAAFCSLEAGVVVSGSGRLATINFTSRTLGVSALTFLNVMKRLMDGTYLLDPNSSMIAFDVNVGIVEVIGSGFHRDVFNVIKDTQTYHVAVRTNSTVSNFYYNGTSRELGFNLAATAGTKGACIAEIDKNLLNGTLITLLNNVGLCTYTRTLNTLPENTTHCFTYFNFTYNTGTKSIKIRLTVAGDLNGDRKVDVIDLALEVAAFGTVPGSGKWNPVADVDHNLKIDVRDLAWEVKCYGTWLPP